MRRNFTPNQNRPYLDQLASQTGGRYWKPDDLKNLPRDISYSEAGISVRNTKELWNMPIVFAAPLGTARVGVAFAPQMGCGMKRALLLAIVAVCTVPGRAATYYVIVAGLGGEPDYQQRFTEAAKDLDHVFKASGEIAHVYTLTGAQSTASQLTRHLEHGCARRQG